MSITGLLDSTIPKNSFFDIPSHNETRRGALSLFSQLSSLDEILEKQLEEIRITEIKVKDNAFFCMEYIPQDLWDLLPIKSHEIVVPDNEVVECLVKSLMHLQETFESGFIIVKEFVKYIVWTRLKAKNVMLDTQITSSSFPKMPFVIFVSDKANYHIPPNNISKEKSFRILAENIYHEAVHQAVNMNILLNDIFIEEFTSATSEKIEIPWRNLSVKRNQFWEVDRAYHATVVYYQLLKYRFTQLQDNNISEQERAFFHSAIQSGLESALFLSKALLDKRKYFTEVGECKINELFNAINQVKL